MKIRNLGVGVLTVACIALSVALIFIMGQMRQMQSTIRWYEVLDGLDDREVTLRDYDFAHMDKLVLIYDPRGYVRRGELMFFPEHRIHIFSAGYEGGVRYTYRATSGDFLILDTETQMRGQVFAEQGTTVEIENYNPETKELTYYICRTHFSTKCTERSVQEGEDIEGLMASTLYKTITLSHTP